MYCNTTINGEKEREGEREPTNNTIGEWVFPCDFERRFAWFAKVFWMLEYARNTLSNYGVHNNTKAQSEHYSVTKKTTHTRTEWRQNRFDYVLSFLQNCCLFVACLVHQSNCYCCLFPFFLSDLDLVVVVVLQHYSASTVWFVVRCIFFEHFISFQFSACITPQSMHMEWERY